MIRRAAIGNTRVAVDEIPRNSSQPSASRQCGLRKGHSWRKAPRRRVGRGGAESLMGWRAEWAANRDPFQMGLLRGDSIPTGSESLFNVSA
ncbi:hypothetical protein GCM10028797_31040 [Dyella agri]